MEMRTCWPGLGCRSAERRAREAERERQRRAERRTRRREWAHQAIGAPGSAGACAVDAGQSRPNAARAPTVRSSARHRRRRSAQRRHRPAGDVDARPRTGAAGRRPDGAVRVLRLVYGRRALLRDHGQRRWRGATGAHQGGQRTDALVVARRGTDAGGHRPVDLSQRPEEGCRSPLPGQGKSTSPKGIRPRTCAWPTAPYRAPRSWPGLQWTKTTPSPLRCTPISQKIRRSRSCAPKNMTVKTRDASVSVRLAEGTVQDALNKAGITYDPKDEISPSLDTPISEGLQIVLTTVDVKIETKTYSVAYKTIEQKSSSLAKGKTKVSREGKEGVRTVVEQVTYKDGRKPAARSSRTRSRRRRSTRSAGGYQGEHQLGCGKSARRRAFGRHDRTHGRRGSDHRLYVNNRQPHGHGQMAQSGSVRSTPGVPVRNQVLHPG